MAGLWQRVGMDIYAALGHTYWEIPITCGVILFFLNYATLHRMTYLLKGHCCGTLVASWTWKSDWIQHDSSLCAGWRLKYWKSSQGKYTVLWKEGYFLFKIAILRFERKEEISRIYNSTIQSDDIQSFRVYVPRWITFIFWPSLPVFYTLSLFPFFLSARIWARNSGKVSPSIPHPWSSLVCPCVISKKHMCNSKVCILLAGS